MDIIVKTEKEGVEKIVKTIEYVDTKKTYIILSDEEFIGLYKIVSKIKHSYEGDRFWFNTKEREFAFKAEEMMKTDERRKD